MAKVKVINGNIDLNLNGNNFNNIPSQTIFTFGNFTITTNFDGKIDKDYSSLLTNYNTPISLNSINLTNDESKLLYYINNKIKLNLDNSNLNTFIRFGSAYEYLKLTINNIILKYPYSIYVNSNYDTNITVIDYIYDDLTNTSTFKIPESVLNNKYGLNYTDNSYDDFKNLKSSYDLYDIYFIDTNKSFSIINYTGLTNTFITLKVNGNPFENYDVNNIKLSYHIKPNIREFEKFRNSLNDYDKYILSNRVTNGFEIIIDEPILTENNDIIYQKSKINWPTTDKYNIDVDGTLFNRFIESIFLIANKYDNIKTDLIYRFLTTESLKLYDNTDNNKISKLLRIYGYEFDNIRKYIDSLVYINKISYDKINNIPDYFIKNIANTLGWEYFSILSDDDISKSFLSIDNKELNKNLLPAEIDIELWRRILINSNYIWKSKGTRESINSILMMIGIPKEFINITEYVYTISGKINPNKVKLEIKNLSDEYKPYDIYGYPKAPLETSDYYFQMNGDSDSGQKYMDYYREVGFDLKLTVDNKKSWSESGSTYRKHYSTQQYYQKNSKLVLNTKEIDITLDSSKGLEYDVYNYIIDDFKINSSGYTLPYSFVNISLNYNGSSNEFALPINYEKERLLGNLEIRYDGILLNSPIEIVNGNTITYDTSSADYEINYDNNSFRLLNNNYANNTSIYKNVIQVSFIYSGRTTHSMSGISLNYKVIRLNADLNGTRIPIPVSPNGDIQLTIDGIGLTKKTDNLTGDYIVDYDNNNIIITNESLIQYLIDYPEVQISYLNVIGNNDIYNRNELFKINSFNGDKLYYSQYSDKYIYRMNYKANNNSDIKLLINGIGLEVGSDYRINQQNQFELIINKSLKYGDVISIYYLVGGNSIFHPIIKDIFGFGDISNLSFLEFIELLRRKTINSRNIKTITDHKGGWYPSLLRIYVEYLKRSKLDSNNPLLSNGYNFNILYNFLSKYDTFFNKLLNYILPSTAIIRKEGVSIRNSIFTNQKYTYKRGVNLLGKNQNNNNNTDSNNNNNVIKYDFRGNYMYWYLGNDGSVFKIAQTLSKNPVNNLKVYTCPAIINTCPAIINGTEMITGGYDIIGYSELTSYGIYYRCKHNNNNNWCNLDIITNWCNWDKITNSGNLYVNNYNINLNNLDSNTIYEYKSYINSDNYSYTGNTLSVLTSNNVITPKVNTCEGISTYNSILNTGGYNIIGYEDVDYHGMEYRCVLNVSTSSINLNYNSLELSKDSHVCNLIISGDSCNNYTVIKEPALNWITYSEPITLLPNGVNTDICVSNNTSNSDRNGTICYIPTYGDVRYVSIHQASKNPIDKMVFFTCKSGGYKENLCELSCATITTNTAMCDNDYYSLSLGWYTQNPSTSTQVSHNINVKCNDLSIFNCNINVSKYDSKSGIIPSFIVKKDDIVDVILFTKNSTLSEVSSISSIYINKIIDNNNNYKISDIESNITGIKAETNTIYNCNI